MITIFTENDCLMFNFGGFDREIDFAATFEALKKDESTTKKIKVMHPEKGNVLIDPKKSTIKLEKRRYVENDAEAIDNFFQSLYSKKK